MLTSLLWKGSNFYILSVKQRMVCSLFNLLCQVVSAFPLVISSSPCLVYFMKDGNRLLKWGFLGVITGTEATNLWHHKCAGRHWFNWKEAEKPNKMEVSSYLDLGCWLDQWMYEVILDWRAHVSSCPTELWNLSLSWHYCTFHGNSFPLHCSPRNCIDLSLIYSLWLIICFIWARGLGMARTAEARDDVSALQVGLLS